MPVTEPPIGRREWKKAATRQAVSDAALQLFLDRGFDDVTIREPAEAEDVSTTTLMKHFSTNEALVFDRDDERERSLIAAVTERPPKTFVLDALSDCLRARVVAIATQRRTAFMKLVLSTPALTDYWQRMWRRHEQALARALAADLRRPEGDRDVARWRISCWRRRRLPSAPLIRRARWRPRSVPWSKGGLARRAPKHART